MISREIAFVAALAVASPAAAQITGTISSDMRREIRAVDVSASTWAEQDREIERQDREREKRDREIQRAQSERDREDSLYEQGTDALWNNRWDRALTYFTRLAELKSARADAALYWKAYAQNRLGQRAESLATIAELTKGYPGSNYMKQAKALEVEVRNASGQPPRPEAQADEEMKLLALNSLAHSNAQEAVPLLENVLNGTGTPRLKSQALFVLAQINDAKAREILKNVAKGSAIPELQGRAIQYLGVHGGPESRATLAEIYASSTDIELKRRILRAFMVAGEKDRLFKAAQTESSKELRLEAVRQLGVMGANDYLWQMYQKETDVDVKRQIISAMAVGGNTTRMIELAKTEKDTELRRTVIRNLGIMGSKAVGDALVELYAAEKDPAIRRQIVNSLFTQGNATALVALARKESDINMKKEMVQKLSMMDSPAARNYMLELLK
ncbi:MAG TPA: HEAT repeat domain-containing protein [Vicinamibacterales bacterium]|nr:HEAT repeat domain-containing protein [Vicinamibacterales bacterium]